MRRRSRIEPWPLSAADGIGHHPRPPPPTCLRRPVRRRRLRQRDGHGVAAPRARRRRYGNADGAAGDDPRRRTSTTAARGRLPRHLRGQSRRRVSDDRRRSGGHDGSGGGYDVEGEGRRVAEIHRQRRHRRHVYESTPGSPRSARAGRSTRSERRGQDGPADRAHDGWLAGVDDRRRTASLDGGHAGRPAVSSTRTAPAEASGIQLGTGRTDQLSRVVRDHRSTSGCEPPDDGVVSSVGRTGDDFSVNVGTAPASADVYTSGPLADRRPSRPSVRRRWNGCTLYVEVLDDPAAPPRARTRNTAPVRKGLAIITDFSDPLSRTGRMG